MLNLSVPALLQIREGITINLALSVSQSVEPAMPQYKLKDDIKKLSEEGKLARSLRSDDYIQTGTADTVSFWFIDGRSLVYRVGEEISSDDFARIEDSLTQLQYRLK